MPNKIWLENKELGLPWTQFNWSTEKPISIPPSNPPPSGPPANTAPNNIVTLDYQEVRERVIFWLKYINSSDSVKYWIGAVISTGGWTSDEYWQNKIINTSEGKGKGFSDDSQ